MAIYAQILKETNEVVLIGGEELGLPVYSHELVYCVEITQEENVFVGMMYDPEEKRFEKKQMDHECSGEQLNSSVTEIEQRELDRDEMLIDLLIQQQEILLALQTKAAN